MTAIVAMAENRVIGKDGGIPWHYPEDLRYFKKTTLGHAVVMGRKTFESIGKPLPGRTNYVVSATADFPGVEMLRSVRDVPRTLPDGRDVFVIGGAGLYESLLPECDRLLLTLVKKSVDGDTFFPASYSEIFRSFSIVETTPDLEFREYRR